MLVCDVVVYYWKTMLARRGLRWSVVTNDGVHVGLEERETPSGARTR
jgi:hypothetical protein